MKQDNPYAAPQTLEPQFEPAALPLAEFQQPVGRRRFPNQSTAQLQRLFEQSRPLEAMLLVWLALWFVTVAFLAALFLRASASSDSYKLVGWFLAGIVTARLLSSFWRTKTGRWFMLVVDGGLGVTCVVGWAAPFTNVSFTTDNLFKFGAIGLIVLAIALLAYRSCRTLLTARELFQPSCVQHDDLVRELRYRQEFGID